MTGTKRPRRERTRAEPKPRSEWRRNIAEKFPAARTPAVVVNGPGGIRAKPVAASLALRIDALHRKAGQILHDVFPSGFALTPGRSTSQPPAVCRPKNKPSRALCRAPFVVSREKAQDMVVALPRIAKKGAWNRLDQKDPPRFAAPCAKRPPLARLPSKHSLMSAPSSTRVARFAAPAPHRPHHLPCVRQHRSMRATPDLGWGGRRGGGDAESDAWRN